MRADAIRDRAKILATAREQITTHGVEVGMDEIAAAAGVAVGTLYRHFPNKTELVAAVIADFYGQMADDAEAASRRVTTGAHALDEIAEFLCGVIEAAADNHAAKTACIQTGDAAAEQRATAAMNHLIQAGQAAGDIHPDITVKAPRTTARQSHRDRSNRMPKTGSRFDNDCSRAIRGRIRTAFPQLRDQS